MPDILRDVPNLLRNSSSREGGGGGVEAGNPGKADANNYSTSLHSVGFQRWPPFVTVCVVMSFTTVRAFHRKSHVATANAELSSHVHNRRSTFLEFKSPIGQQTDLGYVRQRNGNERFKFYSHK